MTVHATPPRPEPSISAAEAIGIALSVCVGNASPNDTVALVLMAIEQAGWKIVPREETDSGHDSAVRTERPESVNRPTEKLL